MTDEEMRIAIAEECGFQRWKTVSGIVVLTKPRDEQQRAYWITCGDQITSEPVTNISRDTVPDYLNDLNAMHEAEKTLSRAEAIKFRVELSKNSDGRSAQFLTVEAAMCHATASQRAEAFLKVKGRL